MTKEEIISAFQFRHACKEFDSTKKISDDDFEFILETARLSPSSFGYEPWHFIVVQNPELREKIKEGAWGAPLKFDTASHVVVCLAMKSELIRYDSPYIKQFTKEVQKLSDEYIARREKFYENFQKSDFDLTDDRKLFDWATKQTYIAMGNMMTAAAMIGIDSCPIEGFNQKLTDAILAKDFGVDTNKYGVAYMIAFGYRKNPQGVKTRRMLEQIVTRM